MTIAPHNMEIHQLVDRLTVSETEGLYVLLKGIAGDRVTAPPDDGEGAGGPNYEGLPDFVGMVNSGDPKFSASADAFLRERLFGLGGE